MISKVVVFHCPKCNSTNVVRNGKNRAGSQQFLCRDCKKSAVMYPQNRRTEADKEQILAAYHERPTSSAVRGIARIYHIGRGTLKELLKKKVREQVTTQQSLLRLMMYSNWMKFGLLSLFELQNTGYGRHYADEHAKSWLL